MRQESREKRNAKSWGCTVHSAEDGQTLDGGVGGGEQGMKLLW